VSAETRAYDKHNDDGFPPDPVVVLVATGTTDVSRLVQALSRGNSEQIKQAEHIARQLRRHNAGRAALSLLKQHGGNDFTNTRPASVPVDLAGFFMSQDEGGYPELRYAKSKDDSVGVFVCDADGTGLDELVNRANDFEPEEMPATRQWAVRHPEVLLSVHRSRDSALYTLSKLPGGVLVTRMSDEGDDAWTTEAATPAVVDVELPEPAEAVQHG
jgi:hypothetical protein